jgi:SIR2-like domain
MSLLDNKEAITSLKSSFKRGELTLYLGAGVSIPSGLPSWEHLVLLIYFRTLHADINMNVYSNYLLAVAEWILREKKDPLDVVIRKIRKTWSENDFMDVLRESLYGNIRDSTGRVFLKAIDRNRTLQSIVSDLLNKSVLKSRGVRTVITYNYDNLLQLALERKKIDKKFQTIYKDVPEYKLNKIPIYHVHGYLPIQKTANESMPDELVFSEERYNSIFQDSYYWGNMIQTQNLSSNTGLMIGISLSDKNIRRLLDAIKKAPIARNNYILMKRSALKEPLEGSEDLAFIKDRARKWMDRMANSGIKKESQEYSKIRNVVRDIVDFETSNFANIYTDLGIQVLLYDRHEEIPGFIKKISAR